MVDVDDAKYKDLFPDVSTTMAELHDGLSATSEKRSQKPDVDGYARRLGIQGATGLSFTKLSANNDRSPLGMIAIDEATHLLGIARRNQKYRHSEDEFKYVEFLRAIYKGTRITW
jgi:hypothetical protein